ncbi:HEPN domain-containing protein [Runella sp.]|uniref:HEPN domain-containing protein n=1 Tax=Runella sp. TaxID=1960881 RepID=UPI003D0E85C6
MITIQQEIEKYIQKAHDCLSDSLYLLEGKRFEAACNRSYYAIFDMIQAGLAFQNAAAKTHTGAHTKFRELFIKSSIFPDSFNNIINDSFSLRQNGDYDNDYNVSLEEATRSFEEAALFVNTISDYLRKHFEN